MNDINSEILNQLHDYLTNNPNIGFTTALYNLGILPIISNIMDLYYENPTDTLKRMNNTKEKNMF